MGTENLLGYPLAIAASLALMSPRPNSTSGDFEHEGAGGALHSNKSRSPSEQFEGSSVSPISNPTINGRSSAETPELAALRSAESRLFPEYKQAPRDLKGSVPTSAACDAPEYDLARSVDATIPAAPDWLKGLERPEIAVPRDPKVAKYIRHFGAGTDGRAEFASWLRRSGAYRRIVTEALEKRGLPRDLMAVMFVESGCWPKAVSPAGAAGLWQFMPQTAQAYGLTVRADYDERRSIWRATDAAINHLGDLYTQFQSWHLALAAYNLGYQRLQDRLQQTKTEDFFSLAKQPNALPAETALYVPKVLAIAVILRNLEYFGFDDVEQLPELSASRISVPPNTRLSLLARAAGTSVRRIRDLNPQFLTDQVPDLGSITYAHLPNSGLSRAKMMLPRLLNAETDNTTDLKVTNDFDWGRDEIESNWKSRLGRTIPSKSSVKNTDSDNAEAVSADDAITYLPARRNRDASAQRSESRNHSDSTTEQGDTAKDLAYVGNRDDAQRTSPRYYRVKRGDTLSELARYFDIPQDELARYNGLKNPSHILAGTRLRILSQNQ